MSCSRFANPVWHLVDARNQVLGRMATQVVRLIRGKHKPTYNPCYDCGDYVVIINAKHVKLTGNKKDQKLYRWHTGFPGGLKEMSAKTLLDRKPEEVVRKAVLGMLAKNRLRHIISHKLRVFPEDRHLHEDKLPPGTPSILA